MRPRDNHRHLVTFTLFASCAISLLLGGCVVEILSGPSRVEVGETVVYELDVSSNLGSDDDIVLTIVAQVPNGWVLASSTFVGVIDGIPTSGSGSVVPEQGCDGSFGMPFPGTQRIRVDAGPFPTTHPDDTGVVTLEFQALDQPEGEFKLGFTFGGEGSTGGSLLCGPPAYRTINRSEGLISFVQALFDDVNAPTLAESESIQVTSDGQFVLSTAFSENALNFFARDTETGELSLLESHVDGIGGVDGLLGARDVEISPEGSHVFVAGGGTGGSAITIFELENGSLTYLGAAFGDVFGVLDLAIWDRFIYATTADGVSVFERNVVTGELAFVQSINWDPLPPSFSTERLVTSPDGRHLYVTTTNDSIAVLSRDSETGEVKFEEAVTLLVHFTSDLVISPDGRHLYVEGGIYGDSGISLYERDSTDGGLSYVYTLGASAQGPFLGDVLFNPRDLALSPAGEILFLGSSQAVAAFARLADGELRILDFEFQGDPPVTGIPDLNRLAISPDGRHLYATSDDPGSVAAFVAGPAYVFTDGFESGDTTAWSSAVP